MKRKWWIVIAVVVVAGLGVAGWLLVAGQQETSAAAQAAMEKAVVRQDTLQVTVEGSGNMVPRAEVQLAFLASGKVDAVLVNKIDVMPHFDFNMEAFQKVVFGLNPDVEIFPISCKTGEGLDAWISWLREEMKKVKK